MRTTVLRSTQASDKKHMQVWILPRHHLCQVREMKLKMLPSF